jgi:hypothetical protein
MIIRKVSMRTNIRYHSTILLLVALGCLALFSGCLNMNMTIPGRWCDREIFVDGLDTEWEGTRFLVDKKDVTIGAMNDDRVLYLRLSTPDRATQWKIARHGLTVWFDPRDGNSKVMGISYPIILDPDLMHLSQDDVTSPGQAPDPTLDTPDSLAVLIGKDDRTVLSRSDALKTGVDVAVGFKDGLLIYELMIPLDGASGLYPVLQPEDGQVSVGFETPLADLDAFERKQRLNERTIPGSGDPNIRRGSEPSRGRDRTARRMNIPQPLAVWVSVMVADPPDSGTELSR